MMTTLAKTTTATIMMGDMMSMAGCYIHIFMYVCFIHFMRAMVEN